MLTLQNDPPGIDSGTDDKEQFKGYSKVFRKMLTECMRKEPEKRQSAKQLQKHEFFKKAKVSRDSAHYLLDVNFCLGEQPFMVEGQFFSSYNSNAAHQKT